MDWGAGPEEIGGRKDVFNGYPFAVYLPSGISFEVSAVTTCEFADCRTPSSAPLARGSLLLPIAAKKFVAAETTPARL